MLAPCQVPKTPKLPCSVLSAGSVTPKSQLLSVRAQATGTYCWASNEAGLIGKAAHMSSSTCATLAHQQAGKVPPRRL